MQRPTVAIVGAGIVGCLAAREITARHPDVHVTVIDRDGIGTGVSRRSAGLHLARGASPRIRKMSALSHGYYANLAPTLPSGLIFPLDGVIVAGSSNQERLVEQYLPEAAVEPMFGVPSPLRELPPGSGSWKLAGSQYADVYRLAQSIAAGLRGAVDFWEGVRVAGVEAREDEVFLVLGSGDRLRVDQVVLAPGAWISDPAWRDLVAPLGLRVKKVVALHLGVMPEPSDPVIVFEDVDAFLLPVFHRGHWLFSYTCDAWDVDPDDLCDGLSNANLAAGRACLAQYSSDLADACRSGRVFCDAYSPRREPLVQTLDGSGRVIFAGAANGSGYRLAPAIAAEVADLVCLPSTVRSAS